MSSCCKLIKDGESGPSPPWHDKKHAASSQPSHSQSRHNHLGSDDSSTALTTIASLSAAEVSSSSNNNNHNNSNSNSPSNGSSNTAPVSVIMDYHAVLGDRNSRSDKHCTTATTILRQVKHEFKQRYAGRPLSVWYHEAVQDFHARIARAFAHHSTDVAAQNQLGQILIKCTDQAKATDRIQTLYTHRLASQRKAAYGVAKLPTALEFYFKSRSAVTLPARVQHYQDALHNLKQQQQSTTTTTPRHLSQLHDEFQDLLDFVVRKINQAAHQSVLAQQLLQKLNIMPALREQWDLLLQEQQKTLGENGTQRRQQQREDATNNNIIPNEDAKEASSSPQQAPPPPPQDGLADLASWDHDQELGMMNGGESLLTMTDETTVKEYDHEHPMTGDTVKETVVPSRECHATTHAASSSNVQRPSHRRCASLPTQGPKNGDLPVDFLHYLPWDEENLESDLFLFEPEAEPLDLIEQQDATVEVCPLKKAPVGHRRSCSVPPQLPQPQRLSNTRVQSKTMLHVPTKAMPTSSHRRRCASDGGADSQSLGSSGQKRPRRPRAKGANRRRTHSDSSKRSRHDDSTSHNDVPWEIETRSSEEEEEEEELLAMHKLDVDNDYNDCVDSYRSCDSQQTLAFGLLANDRPLRLAIGDGHSGLYTGMRCHQSGLPHGKGKMVYERDQTVYEGEWCQGLWHGDGYYRDGNRGYMYKGEFFRHGKHGAGTEFFADGSVLQGMFCNGHIVTGEMRYPDGSSYTGQWSCNGVPHGQGTFVAVDGGVFEGAYLNGERTQGTFRYPNGIVYCGEWSQTRPNGHGETEFPDGTTYRGEHKDGLFHGKGKLVWPNGAWYEGEFHAGQKAGVGKECDSNGEVIHEGLFHEGERVVDLFDAMPWSGNEFT